MVKASFLGPVGASPVSGGVFGGVRWETRRRSITVLLDVCSSLQTCRLCALLCTGGIAKTPHRIHFVRASNRPRCDQTSARTFQDQEDPDHD